MGKVGVAAAFRHNPDEDGLLIPASTLITEGRQKDQVMPILGYLAYRVNGQTLWSFIKYEAPDSRWPQEKRPSTRGQVATARVANCRCPQCGFAAVMPLCGDGGRMRCLECGASGLEVQPIKENSDEFLQMLGDLHDPLEAAAAAAENSDVEFDFPQVLVTAKGIGVSAAVPAQYAGAISGAGFGVKDIVEVSSFQEMLDLWDKEPALSITPDITSGWVDVDAARKGISQSWPVFRHWLKLWMPERKHGPIPFRTIRF